MSARRRIRSQTGEVTVEGGGDVVIGEANFALGPDFGEAGGSDGNTWDASAAVDLEQVNLASEHTATGTLLLDKVAIDYPPHQATGVLTGSILSAPFWQDAETVTGATLNDTTIPVPSATQQSDLMIAHLCTTSTTARSWTSTGWTLINEDSQGTIHSAVLYRVAGNSEPADYTFTGTTSVTSDPTVGTIHTIRGINTSSPINVDDVATLSAAALDPDPDSPEVTTTVDNCLVMSFLSHDHLALAQTHTPDANHVERTDAEDGTAVRVSQHTQERVFGTAGATGTVEHDCTETAATDAVMHRVAIKPGRFFIPNALPPYILLDDFSVNNSGSLPGRVPSDYPEGGDWSYISGGSLTASGGNSYRTDNGHSNGIPCAVDPSRQFQWKVMCTGTSSRYWVIEMRFSATHWWRLSARDGSNSDELDVVNNGSASSPGTSNYIHSGSTVTPITITWDPTQNRISYSGNVTSRSWVDSGFFSHAITNYNNVTFVIGKTGAYDGNGYMDFYSVEAEYLD